MDVFGGNVEEFLRQDFIIAGLESKLNAMIKDFLQDRHSQELTLTVHDEPAAEKQQRILSGILDHFQGELMPEERFRFHLDRKSGVARYVIITSLEKAAQIMVLF